MKKMSKWGRGQPRTVPDFRVLVVATAVDALVVDARSLLDGGGGDDDAVLGREHVEAQHHRSHCCGQGHRVRVSIAGGRVTW